jgi:hypothetical protein
MNTIATIFLRATARTFFITGTFIIAIGLICRAGMFFYSRSLLRTLEFEMREMHGTSFSVNDALFNLKLGIAISYLLVAIGSAMIFVGVGRIRQVPTLITS